MSTSHASDSLQYSMYGQSVSRLHRAPVSDDPNMLRQRAIRRVLRLNEKKKLSGKPRGRKWIRGKQAECAIYGHSENPFSGPNGVCYYCGAKA